MKLSFISAVVLAFVVANVGISESFAAEPKPLDLSKGLVFKKPTTPAPNNSKASTAKSGTPCYCYGGNRPINFTGVNYIYTQLGNCPALVQKAMNQWYQERAAWNAKVVKDKKCYSVQAVNSKLSNTFKQLSTYVVRVRGYQPAYCLRSVKYEYGNLTPNCPAI